MATPTEQKPWKAEYAKSSRASCRTCSSPIAKDTFRLARMLQSTQFDGYMAHWHHSSCIFSKKKKQVKDWNDVEGGDTLRWEDQQRLRKYIDGGPSKDGYEEQQGGKPAKGKGGKSNSKENGGGEDGGGEYAIENAKSSRSTCKSCDEKIEKGQVRISTMATAEGGRFRGKVAQWRHAKCFFETEDWTGSVADLPGWNSLTSEDQATVQAQANPSAPAGKQKNAVKAEAASASQPKAGRGKKTQIEHDAIDEKPSKRQKKKNGSEVTAAVAADEKVVAKKTPKEKETVTAVKRKDIQLENKLEKQSKDLWAIKDKLREHVSTAEMRELLSENNQDANGSEYDLRERCADGMMFGPLEKCPLCEGFMEYQGGSYRCRGFLTAWSKCTYTTRTPKRTSAKWEIGEECDNDYLVQWFKTQSKKKGERLLVPASTPAKPSSGRKPGTSDELFLEGCEFVVIGKVSVTQAKLKAMVEAAGGRLRSGTTGVWSTVTCVVTTENMLQTDKFRQDLAHAREVPIVKEQYLLDCLEKKEKLSMDAYKLELDLKLQLVKVKVKGRGSVHADSGLQEVGHIFEEGKVLYATTLNRSEIGTGVNSFYVLQLVEEDAKKTAHHLYRKWGRVGNDRIGGDKIEKLSKAEGIKEFKRLFKEKTGNEWESWIDRENFEKQPGKFYPLEIDYGVDETPRPQKALSGSKSKLHPRVVNLMKILFDLETYKSAMREFEINMSEMPLGKLSKRHIERGYAVLTEIQNILGNAEQGPRQQGLLVDASNRFCTLIPTIHPLVISDEQTLKTKIHMLEALRDIEIASEFLDTKDEAEGSEEEDPLDSQYKKLHCGIEPLDHNGSDFKLVEKYLKQTHAPTHTEWALELEDVFAVDRDGEAESFTPFKMCLDNHMLLWHGSRTTNYVGILSQGLRIAPPEAPVTGYMFGKGLYFADLVSKSAQYCYTSKTNSTGLLLLSEVALGKTNNLKKAQYMEKPADGTNSTVGLGKKKPLESEFEKFEDDVVVPCGKPVPSGVRSELMYNEYIVYDKAQVKLRFLLKVNFKHKR